MDKVDPTTWLKDHEIAALVNELTRVAISYHNHQSLRQRISDLVVKTVRRRNENENERK